MLDQSDPRWELIKRICSSAGFIRSPRLIQLLEHIAERALTGRLDELSEQKIGVQLFARPADYSPAEDNIVRSHARLLRQKLDQYFATEGEGEPLRLTIPKGGYLPSFETTAPAAEPVAVEEVIVAAKGWSNAHVALVLVAGCILGACGFYAASLWRAPEIRNPLWSLLFQPGRTTLVIPADSGLVMYENLAKRSVGLTEYVQRLHLSSAGKSELATVLGARRYTSYADLSLISRLIRLPQVSRGSLRVAFARDLGPNDFKQANLILSGAAEANPWVELFQNNINFSIEKEQPTDTFLIRNRHPLAGEPVAIHYDPHDASQFAYAQVAFVPSDGNIGHALLISGTTTAGTEAAADFVLNDALLQPILARAKSNSGLLGSFELLLRTRNLGGSAPQAEVAFSRYGPLTQH